MMSPTPILFIRLVLGELHTKSNIMPTITVDPNFGFVLLAAVFAILVVVRLVAHLRPLYKLQQHLILSCKPSHPLYTRSKPSAG
jgi:hypothetical protein